MNFIVLLKMTPDVVEELEIADDGRRLDPTSLRMILSEWCGHALEQAVLLKERHGGTITVVALQAPEVEEALFTAAALGAGRLMCVEGDFSCCGGPAEARVLAEVLRDRGAITPDSLILTGSQAIDDLEGEMGAHLAHLLDLPYLGVITGVTLQPENNKVIVLKEFAGGLRGRFALPLPAVLGIQAAERPPRYVPVAKVMAARKTAKIETVTAAAAAAPTVDVARLFKPEAAGRARMLDGPPEDAARRLAGILAEQGLIPGGIS
ncbi:MAG: electron transfer flavoprotein subunit beta/FixA family protein [Candidatus Sumerlaeia bacterium]